MHEARLKGKILIVDDDAMIRKVLQNFLDLNQIESLTASDGQEALELYSGKADSIDLVILDLNMPGLNGQETFYRLLEMNKDIRVLLATGDIENKAIDAMKEKGLKYIIQKPLRFEKLKSILDTL